MSSAIPEVRNTSEKSPNFLSHIIINHSLKLVHLVTDSSDEFIEFTKKIFGIFEYNYEIKTVFDAKKEYAINFHLVTEKMMSDIYSHFTTILSNRIPYNLYTYSPETYDEGYRNYIRSYSSFFTMRDKTKNIFSNLDFEKEEKSQSNLLIKPNSELENKNSKGLYDTSAAWNSYFTNMNPEIDQIQKKDSVLLGSDIEWTLPTGVKRSKMDPTSFYFIDNDWSNKTMEEKYHPVAILYDEGQSMTYVVSGEDCKWVTKWGKLMDGTTVLKEYDKLYSGTCDTLQKYFQCHLFIDLEDAREKVNSYDLLHQLSKKRNPVEAKIQAYLLSNYNISMDGKKMIKASVLQERIETALLSLSIGDAPVIESVISDTLKFRKMISSVLLEIGLQKKRLSEGIFYYGIEPKLPREQDMEKALEEVINDRKIQSDFESYREKLYSDSSPKNVVGISTKMENRKEPIHSPNKIMNAIVKQPNHQLRSEPDIFIEKLLDDSKKLADDVLTMLQSESPSSSTFGGCNEISC